jgi:hypothetical protein
MKIITTFTLILLFFPGLAFSQQICGPNGQCGQMIQYGNTQQWHQPQSPTTGTHASTQFAQIVQISTNDYDGAHSNGTGTIVGVKGNIAYVLTCWHILRDYRGGGITVNVNRRPYQATIVKQSQHDELLLLAIKNPDVTPVVVATNISTTSTLHGYGYGGGPLRRIFGRLVRLFRDRNTQTHTIVIRARAPQGYSGGPLLNSQGHLVGVIWGSDATETYATSCIQVNQIFSQYIINQPSTLPGPVDPEDPAPDIPVPTEDPCKDLAEKVAAIEERLVALENQENPCEGLEERIALLESKPNAECSWNEERIKNIEFALDNANIELAELQTTVENLPSAEDIVEQIYGKLADDLQNLEMKIDQIPQVDVDQIINEVINRIGYNVNVSSTDRVLYFTANGAAHCVKTDEVARKLKDQGVPITIITLKPEDASVSDVPRIHVIGTGLEHSGASNVMTYFTTLSY